MARDALRDVSPAYWDNAPFLFKGSVYKKKRQHGEVMF